MKIPCKDCTARVIGCHVTCRLYKEYKRDNDQANIKRKKYLFDKDVYVRSMLRNGRRR